MSDLLAVHLAVGGAIIAVCAVALRFKLVGFALRPFDFEPEHISFLNAVLWIVIAFLSFVILRDFWRAAFQ